MTTPHHHNTNAESVANMDKRRRFNTTTAPTSSLWQKLLRYYGDCIAVENAGKITLYSSMEGEQFVQVPAMEKEWVASGREKLEFKGQNEKIQQFINALRWNSNPPSYFYGILCYIKQSQQRRMGQDIQPFLIFGVDYKKTESGDAFILQSDKPRINSAFLTDKNLLTSAEERKRLAEAVLEAWNDEESRESNIKKILALLAKLLPPEISFSNDILDGKTTELKAESGIFPLGVIFQSADSKFTRGLEQELSELQKSSTPNSIWRLIFARKGENKANSDEELLEINELNDEQRKAVKSAFNNTISVITGPPGTGKSQVVLNIIANALLHNESVLFGSKNHKAVDVVMERLEQLLSKQKEPEQVILRYGKKERETEFAEALLKAINRAFRYNSESLSQEIRKCRENLETERWKEKDSQQSLNRIDERKNKINHLDTEIEAIKTELQAKLPSSISRNLNSYQKIASKWKFYTSFISLDHLAISLIFVYNNRKLLAKWINKQSALLKLVQKNENEARVEALQKQIAKSKECAISISIRYVNALMKRRLKLLTLQERRDIADYVSIVRQLNNNIVEGMRAKKLRDGRERKFKSVVRTFPAMAVTNLSVRHALPLWKEIVDIVVIDEASQCDIASALPLLYRGKRAVIIGDQEQLKHISHLYDTDEQQLQQKIGLTLTDDHPSFCYKSSLFELAKNVVDPGENDTNSVILDEHYRSRKEIIGFSNEQFYDGELKVRTDYSKLRGTGYPNPVVWHDVIGEAVRPSAGNIYNLNEAKAVVKLIEELIGRISTRKDDAPVSLGIVTPFRGQANKIRILVEKKIPATQLQKLDFIVDTAHKYQGDERDIMIFSPVVSRNVQQSLLRILLRFLKEEHLLNVAITRAKAELHTVGDKTACAQSGIPRLSAFVKYVEELGDINKSGGKFESPWEKILYDALAREGIKTIPQYQFHQYRLDLAFLDSATPIDIEIDGEKWHRSISGGNLEEDLKRDQHLTMHGWQVKRFWVYQLKHNLEQCVREIKEMLESEKPPQKTPPHP